MSAKVKKEVEKTENDFEKYCVNGGKGDADVVPHPEFFPDMRKTLEYDKIIPEDKIAEFEDECFRVGSDFMYMMNCEWAFLGEHLNSAKTYFKIYKTFKNKLKYLKEMTGIK